MKYKLKIVLWTAAALLYASIQIVATPAVGQTPAKPAPALAASHAPAAAPVITDAQRARFFKAQSQAIQAAAAAKDTQAEFQQAIAEMQQACGAEATLTLNKAGDPVCMAKPKIESAAPKK